MKLLSLSINNTPIPTIANVPSGGLGAGGSGTNLIQVALNLLVLVGLILSIIFLLYSGLQWVLSGGDKEKLQKAKQRLTYSIIGLLVITLSFVIVSTVLMLIGATPKFFLSIPESSPPCTSSNCREDRPQTPTVHCQQDNCNGAVCDSSTERCRRTGIDECSCVPK